jgi:hypothetical protein
VLVRSGSAVASMRFASGPTASDATSRSGARRPRGALVSENVADFMRPYGEPVELCSQRPGREGLADAAHFPARP